MQKDYCLKGIKNSTLLHLMDYCTESKIQGLLTLIQQQRGKGNFFPVFLLTGLKGRIEFPKYSFREGKFYDCIFDGYCLRYFKNWVFHFIGS
ncbi:hypothetical protein PP677_003842 [Salmonella enterica]|nr:hypothetical protein [Salmonella enterica]EEM8632209.1 hypothetical protein [Salmonella enterica subsp. enterica serovar Nima]EIV1999654.1 hypothetical protein [Salmonella enterica subsp. enterica serovar Telelkebir]EEC4477025.1 hypothetical protein [Salmonella enterica]EGY1962381.1 hypothetical protein [Salmonella enterica]